MMNIKWLSSILFISAMFSTVQAEGDTDARQVAKGAVFTLSGATLSRADVAVAQSAINANWMRGALGEAVAEEHVLNQYLNQGKRWVSLSVRNGPQGLDHVFIRVNKDGMPTFRGSNIIVGESKYGKSQLGKKAGQMTEQWVRTRMSYPAQAYGSVQKQAVIEYGQKPMRFVEKLKVELRDGKNVYFWRENETAPWKFTGDQKQLEQAKSISGAYGKSLSGVSEGKIGYRGRLYHLYRDKNDLVLEVRRADNVTAGQRTSSLPMDREIPPHRFKNILKKGLGKSEIIRDELSRALKRSYNMTEREAITQATKLTKQMTIEEGLAAHPYKTILKGSAAMLGIGIGVDAGMQLWQTGTVSLNELAQNAGILVSATAMTYGMNYLYTNTAFRSMLSKIHIGSSSARFVFAGASFTAANLAWDMGKIIFANGSWNDLAWNAATNITAAAVSGLAYSSIVAIPSMVGGVAGTGTAISSLTGAAYSSASLAWLGGGSVFLGTCAAYVGVGTAIAACAYTINYVREKWEIAERRAHDLELTRFYRDEFGWNKILMRTQYSHNCSLCR